MTDNFQARSGQQGRRGMSPRARLLRLACGHHAFWVDGGQPPALGVCPVCGGDPQPVHTVSDELGSGQVVREGAA